MGTGVRAHGEIRPGLRAELFPQLSDLGAGDSAEAGEAAVDLARLVSAGLPVRPGFVALRSTLDELRSVEPVDDGTADLPAVVRELGIAYAALGIEGMGGARVTVRPVPAPTDPLTPGGLDPVRGAPAVRRRLLAAPAGRDSAGGVLVQVASPRPERTGWAYVVGCWVDGPAMVGEAGPFVGPTRCPPPGAMLREIGRLARLARAVLQQPCEVRWVSVGPRVELIEVRRSAATR